MLDKLLEENADDSNLMAILITVKDDMLLVLDNNPAHSANSLGVPKQTKRRRKSCGNIARI
jgi:hypothetical protein